MFSKVNRPRAHAQAWRTMKLGAALLGALLITGPATQYVTNAAAAERVVVAIDPLGAESNLYWETIGGFILPSMQTLVGNDPVTGKYDASGLVESWEHNDDFTSWTFHLHPNAMFHDGWGPVTAADVVHSHALHVGPDSKLSGIDLLRDATVTAIDDHTVRFDLPTPQPEFLFSHAGRGSMVIYSKAQFDAEGLEGYMTQPTGSGPFRYEKADIGQAILFSSVKDHWSGVDPAFDELEIRWVGEPSTRLALLLSGEAQIASLPRELQAQAVDAGHRVITSNQAAMQSTLVFSGRFLDDEEGDNFAWRDVRVREAMNRALDRDAMLQVLYDGRADKLAVYTMDPRFPGYVGALAERFDAAYGYDPERARQLLKQAGYPEKFPEPVIPIIITALAGSPEFAQMAELAQAFFEEVGLQTEMREMDWASLQGERRGYTSDFVHPMRNAPVRPGAIGVQVFFTKHASPAYDVGDPLMSDLGARLLEATSAEEQDEILAGMYARLFESYSHMPIATVPAEVVVNPQFIADWTFPGASSSGLGHFHLIRPVR